MSQRGGRTSPTNSIATSSGGKDIRRQKTRMVDEITEQFEKIGIDVGNPILEKQCEPGEAGRALKLSTNVYGIRMQQKPVFRYDITISGLFGGGNDGREKRPVEFTKRSKEDVVVVDRKNMCRLVFQKITEKHPEIFGDNPYALYYDLQSILYTLSPIDLGAKKEGVLVLDRQDCENIQQLQRFSQIDMLIRKVRDGFDLTIGDLSHLNNDTTQQNHSLQQFIELASSQCALFDPTEHVIISGGTSFLMYPQHYGFTAEDGPDLSDSKYLAIGSHKSVRYVEGPKGRGNRHAALIVETKKTPFHHVGQSLIAKAAATIGHVGSLGEMRANDVTKLHHQFKTLHVEVQYKDRRPQDVRVMGVVEKTPRNTIIEGKNCSVEQYFVERYQMQLKYPCAPMASAQQRGRTNFFPLEICFVKDCQRAALNQLNARETSSMIRSCAVAPNILQPQVEKTVNSLHLHDSEYLKESGITITKIPLKVDAHRLPPPSIRYRKGTAPVESDGKWQMHDAFLSPAECKMWAIYVIFGRNSNARFQIQDLKTFQIMMADMCRSCGMNFPTAADSGDCEGTPYAIEEKILACKEAGCTFVMFITEDVITSLHNVIKSCEQKYNIVTQDLKMNNAHDIVKKGKKETLKNIVCKTNEKLGGVNYTLHVEDQMVRNMITDGSLFIGLGISHPSPLSNQERARGAAPSSPSVIGYAANIREDPFDFIGDFAYDEPRRDEKFSTISTIVESCVERFQVYRGKFPSRVIIFRNGTSEGQFAMSLQYEVPLIRLALSKVPHECKLTLMVSQRAHNIRLFPEPMTVETTGRRVNYNIRPGTVVDQQLTHPEQSEFYLNSHIAIQGTARAPRYTVLLDESQFPLDVIEGFTYALSYCHQIINSPTSLPSPIYIALLYAKRGRALFAMSRHITGNPARHPDGSLNFEQLTNDLSYFNTELRDQRVNA